MFRNNIQTLYRLYVKEKTLTAFNVKLNLVKSGVNFTRNYAASVKTLKDEKISFNESDVDTFGTLSPKPLEVSDQIDEGDVKEEKYLENISSHGKRLRTSAYAKIIKEFIAKRQIQEAIDVVEIRMIKEDRVKPENYIYNLLLGACGRVGYTKKAFHLFNQMKKRGLSTTGGTYTALFNACANSPWPEDGLSRAKRLKELMFEKGIHANDTTYNAMIKAFGRCGDIETAFAIVDEMIKNQIPIKTEVINFLLQSCISNKEAGFLHALLIWRKFQQNKINPDIYSFNLLLYCIRECQLGDPDVAKSLLGLNVLNKLESNNVHLNTCDATNITNIDLYTPIPNLLSEIPYLSNMVELSEIKSREQRLLLVGGFPGLLKVMENYKVHPNIKTFTILLDNLPQTTAAEKSLLSTMNKIHVKPDIDFLNMLIKKRCKRFDYIGAKDVLFLFERYKYRPNIITFGVLALTCENLNDAQTLLKEMVEHGYRVNAEILGALLRQACVKENFIYVLEIMEMCIKENVNPNKRFYEHLETFYKECAAKRKGETTTSFWKKDFTIFRMRYKTWLQEVQPDKTEDVHPWQQFRQHVATKVKNYKDPQVHFKPRITSRYRVKTGTLKKNVK